MSDREIVKEKRKLEICRGRQRKMESEREREVESADVWSRENGWLDRNKTVEHRGRKLIRSQSINSCYISLREGEIDRQRQRERKRYNTGTRTYRAFSLPNQLWTWRIPHDEKYRYPPHLRIKINHNVDDLRVIKTRRWFKK